MSVIPALCEEIVDCLTAIGSPIGDFLQPGLTDQQILRVQSRLPFQFPTAIMDMYKWHNGTKSEKGTTFFPWWGFLPLSDAYDRYRMLSTPNDGHWPSHWFPIFSASDISSIGVSCIDTQAEDCEIVCYEYTAGAQTEFSSLEGMLRTILEAYKAGVIFMGGDGELDQNDDGFAEIARRMNPEVKRWAL